MEIDLETAKKKIKMLQEEKEMEIGWQQDRKEMETKLTTLEKEVKDREDRLHVQASAMYFERERVKENLQQINQLKDKEKKVKNLKVESQRNK